MPEPAVEAPESVKHLAATFFQPPVLYVEQKTALLIRKQALKTKQVHRLRIELRRLRSQISNFKDCFRPEVYVEIKTALKAFHVGLAELRELDVYRLELDRLSTLSYTQRMHQILPGMMDQATYRRQDLLQTLLRDSQDFLQTGGWQQLAQYLSVYQQTGEEVSVEMIESLDRLPMIVSGRVEKILSLQACLDEEAPGEAFHALRIELKALRYTLEDFDPYLDGRYDGALRELRPIQDRMGLIHDRQMWLSFTNLPQGESWHMQGEVPTADALNVFRQHWILEIGEGYHQFQKLWQFLG
jgi:CHAD domain-containing protein